MPSTAWARCSRLIVTARTSLRQAADAADRLRLERQAEANQRCRDSFVSFRRRKDHEDDDPCGNKHRGDDNRDVVGQRQLPVPRMV